MTGPPSVFPPKCPLELLPRIELQQSWPQKRTRTLLHSNAVRPKESLASDTQWQCNWI